jgi:hypothetical protein
VSLRRLLNKRTCPCVAIGALSVDSELNRFTMFIINNYEEKKANIILFKFKHTCKFKLIEDSLKYLGFLFSI